MAKSKDVQAGALATGALAFVFVGGGLIALFVVYALPLAAALVAGLAAGLFAAVAMYVTTRRRLRR